MKRNNLRWILHKKTDDLWHKCKNWLQFTLREKIIVLWQQETRVIWDTTLLITVLEIQSTGGAEEMNTLLLVWLSMIFCLIPSQRPLNVSALPPSWYRMFQEECMKEDPWGIQGKGSTMKWSIVPFSVTQNHAGATQLVLVLADRGCAMYKEITSCFCWLCMSSISIQVETYICQRWKWLTPRQSRVD